MYVVIVIAAETRMSNFMVGLTNDDPSITAPVYGEYHHVQYNGTVPASTTASVSFPPSDEKFRYVIIHKKFSRQEAICIAEVEVFVRCMHAFCVMLKH